MKFISLFLLVLTISSCQVNKYQEPSQTTLPSTTASETPIVPIEVAKENYLKIIVVNSITKEPIPDVSIKMLNTLDVMDQKTDSKGEVKLTSLVENFSYEFEIKAFEYITKTVTVKVNFEKSNEQVLQVELVKIILSPTPQPTPTPTPEPTPTPIPTPTPEPTTNPNAVPLKVLVDTSKIPFGNTEGDNVSIFSNLTSLLEKNAFRVNTDDFSKYTLSDVDILVLPCPYANYIDLEITRIVNFVKSGKKLIILGEWGGYTGFNYQNINNLLKNFNLRINPDLVRETSSTYYKLNPDNIVVSNYSSHFITKDLKKTVFYASASVEVFDAGINTFDKNTTKGLIFSTESGYKIKTYTTGASSVLAVSTLDTGKIVVVGDSSIFSNADSDNNDIINLNEENNSKLALNIFRW